MKKYEVIISHTLEGIEANNETEAYEKGRKVFDKDMDEGMIAYSYGQVHCEALPSTRTVIRNLSLPTEPFDAIEMHPCRMYKDGEESFIEQCEPDEAHFWSVYVHRIEGGLDCVADFDEKEEAERMVSLLQTASFRYHPENMRKKESVLQFLKSFCKVWDKEKDDEGHDDLTSLYDGFIESAGLPPMSADELLLEIEVGKITIR